MDEQNVAAPHSALSERIAAEVMRRHRRRIVWTIAIIVAASGTFGAAAAMHRGLRHPYGVAATIAFLFASPLLLLVTSMTGRRSGRIYKRLEGRELSGVCRGLSEKFGVSVTALRLLFFVLMFVKGAGLVMYVLLDLALPIHPADRARLWRFRISRAFQKGVAVLRART